MNIAENRKINFLEIKINIMFCEPAYITIHRFYHKEYFKNHILDNAELVTKMRKKQNIFG